MSDASGFSYRPLGRTGVQVTELCVGCMLFGSSTDEKDSIAIIDRALDAGLNFIDTANVYNELQPTSQSLSRSSSRSSREYSSRHAVRWRRR